MLRWFIATLAVAVGWGACSKIFAADPEDIKFETYDKVEIKGKFYPGKKGEPCVMFLPKFGSSYKDDDWDQLATALQKKGCAVLMFDYRGHGDSTTIKSDTKFWADPANQAGVKGYNPSKLKTEIVYKDFRAEYLPHLVNDIAAARLFLDRKNDSELCNSRGIILIGGEDGSVLGSMWAYSEQYRYRAKGGTKLPDPEGTDLLGCVWLSMTTSLGSGGVAQATPALTWIADAGGKNHKVPMAFFYGENDSAGKKFANTALGELKGINNKVTLTHSIKDSKLKGSKLLDKDLKTQDDILTYIKALKEEKGVPDWDSKETKKNAYYWLLKGTSVSAKDGGEDSFSPLPRVLLMSP